MVNQKNGFNNGAINSLLGMPSTNQAKNLLKVVHLAAKHAESRRGDPKSRRREPTGRPARLSRRRAGPLIMPNNALYQERNGKTDFTGSTTKQLQQSSWKRNPATSDLMAPRGLGFYDAFNTNGDNAVTSMTVGPATAIDARTTIPAVTTGYLHDSSSDDGHLSSDRDAQLLIIGPARGATQAVVWRVKGSNDLASATRQAFTSPQLESDAPIDAIPVRCSVRIRNYTNNFNVGGLVRVLRATTGRTMMPGLFSNGELVDLMDGIRNHARTTVMTGSEFQSTQQKNTIVCDQTRSLQFESFGKPEKLSTSRLLADYGGTSFDPATLTSVHSTHIAGTGQHTAETVLGHHGTPAAVVSTEGPGFDRPWHAGNPAGRILIADANAGLDPTFSSTAANWSNSDPNPTSFSNMFVDPFTDYCAHPTFTPIFILFEPNVSAVTPGAFDMTGHPASAVGNQYEIRIASQFLAHYKQGTMLANMAREHKSSVERVEKAKQAEDRFGSIFMPALEAAMIGLGVVGKVL